MAGSRAVRAGRAPAVARENVAATKAGAAAAPPANQTRRALGDIGNLAGAMVVRCHVSKDGAAVKQDVLTRGAKQRRTITAGSQVVVKVDNEAESHVAISASIPDDEENATSVQCPNVPRQKPQTRSDTAAKAAAAAAAKSVPGYTARLTARSELVSRLDTDMLEAEEHVTDIDEDDCENELCVVEYVEDMYRFYRRTEAQSCVAPDYMCRQSDINEKMRAILIDWLIEVHFKFGLMPETLFLTTNLLDRYLSVEPVSRKTLQLVGVTAMLVAAKYEEIFAPEVEAIVFISDDTYTRQEVLAMEKSMLNTLRFNLTVPTPYVFVVRFLKAASCTERAAELLTLFFVELCLTEYVAIKYPPSLLAAAAVYTALHTLKMTPSWTPTLRRHSGYAEVQLQDCARLMVALHRKASEARTLVVHKKYSSSKCLEVAALSPATLSFTDTDVATSMIESILSD